MSQPPAYSRAFSFTNFQAINPSTTLPGSQVDLELNSAKATLDAVLANLKLIQRDDGAVANASVGLDQLKAEVPVGFNAPVAWVTGVTFTAGSSTVFQGSGFYRCLVTHTSGVFATDLAAGKWQLIVNLAAVPLVNASQIAVTPSGILTSDAQTALQALDVGKAATSHTHPSSAISDSTAAGRALLTAADVTAQNTLLAGPIVQFTTRAAAAAATIPTVTLVVKIAQFATGFPLSTATYVPGTSSGPMAFQEAGGHWWQLDVSGPGNVLWYGARCDGVADDTAALQAAINALQGTGVGLFIQGACFVSSTINITNAITIFGTSRHLHTISWTSGTLTVFSVVTDNTVKFHDMSFSGPVSASSGSAISLAGSSTHNLGCIVRDCTFFGGWMHFNTVSAAHWVVDSCNFIDPNSSAIVVQNTAFPDSGDSVICNSLFSSARPNTIHVLQRSSGGLKIIGNKFLACQIAYNLVLTGSGTSTSDLLILGNSFEAATVAEISLTRPSGTLTFKNVVIVGNQISITPIAIATDSNASWLGGVTISGNQITSNSTTGACISWGAGDNFCISGNQFTGPGGGTCAGVSIGAAAGVGFVGGNQYVGLFVKVSNGSSSVRVERPVPQSGNVAVTCSTAWGAMFRGTANITFPVAYDGPPEVNCTPGTVTLNGAVSAYASSITASGFTLNVISVTSGGSGQATWEASGVY